MQVRVFLVNTTVFDFCTSILNGPHFLCQSEDTPIDLDAFSLFHLLTICNQADREAFLSKDCFQHPLGFHFFLNILDLAGQV